MRKDEKEARIKYNFIAEHYHSFRTKKHPGGWFYNEMLEMPATLELLGNVNGKRVLDFGCGSGIYTKILKRKRAKIKGFDISPGMLKIAREYVKGVEFKLGSGNKIPFNEKFDIVVASLVLDYFDNLNKPLKEVKRILKKGGYFVFSMGNPVTEITKKTSKKKPLVREFQDYFKERKIYGVWKNILKGNKKRDMRMPTYHKTYETIVRAIVKNGFEIVDYKDCFPLEKAKKKFPSEYRFASNLPYFCVWKVRKK